LILIVKKKIELEIYKYGLNWIIETYVKTKLKSTQWYLMVTLTRGILAMPRVPPRTWHVTFLLFFSKNNNNLNLKKNKKNHRLTGGTPLTTLVISIWKRPNWSTFSKVEMQLTFFYNQVPDWHTSTKVSTIRVIKPYFLVATMNMWNIEFIWMEIKKEKLKIFNQNLIFKMK